MAFQLSAGVNFSEIDLTGIIPSVGTTEAAFVGDFNWGPTNERILIADESQLVDVFGKPNQNNFVSFFTAANFLSYGRNLQIVRSVDGSTGLNSTADGSGVLIENEDKYEENYYDGSGAVGLWAGRYPGSMGNSLTVSICPSSNAFTATMAATAQTTSGSAVVEFSANVQTDAVRPLVVGDYITIGDLGQAEVIAIANGTEVTVNSAAIINDDLVANTVVAEWRWADEFDDAPGTSEYVNNVNGSGDEMHVIVVDEGGLFSGVANTVLEKYPFVSKASDASNNDGSTNYYRDVIKNRSKYVWWMDHMATGTNWGSEGSGVTFTNVNNAEYSQLSGGFRGAPSAANTNIGWDYFKNGDEVDVSLLVTGEAGQTVATHVINNIAEYRRDCVAFLSPEKADVVDNAGSERADAIAYRNTLPSTSYAVMDSAWKKQFDKYNNVYRWVPLNGDIAGLCVRTDFTRDPWFSPAGFNRGQIKNVIKLSWNPNKSERDELYKKGINPVVTFPGEGTILYGDKTLLAKPSAFDRINVRRLFIVLEKAITRAAKYSLFEFNDAFTRAAFVAQVDPYLRDVQGRRGIFDYRVVCDETNNTPEVIDRNEFIGDIYIKPARSINFIQLNFVAVRTGVAFEEVVGKF
jgi:hypothetical protein